MFNISTRSATRRRRLAGFAIVTAAALCAFGAKCIENTNVYVDDDGYTHIAGEMFNETDIQATQLMVRGTLYDEAGGVIAQKDSALCPPDLQAHSQSLFDIRFDNPNVPPHARYEVRPISGITLEQPLPKADILVLGTDAIGFEGIPPIPGFPLSDEDVFFQFDVRNRSDVTFTGIQGCAAAYDNFGKVVAAGSDEFIQIDEEGNVYPATLGNEFRTSFFLSLSEVPASAAYVRAWLWFGEQGNPTSPYQYIMTGPITIQTRTFP